MHHDIHDQFFDKLVARLQAARIGALFDEATQMGLLVSQKQYDRVREYFELGKSEATLHYGGGRPAGTNECGYFVEPTVFTDMVNDSRIGQEEIFGPVAAIISWSTEDELVEAATTRRTGSMPSCSPGTSPGRCRPPVVLQVGNVPINDWFAEPPMTPHGGAQAERNRPRGRSGSHPRLHAEQARQRQPRRAQRDSTDWAGAPL